MKPHRYMADQYEGNAEPDLELYARYGHVAYMHKATEGASHIDSAHARRVRRASALGLTVAHYHFARPDLGVPIGSEVRNFWLAVKPLFVAGDYLIVDLEREAPRGILETTRYEEAFAEALAKVSGHDRVLYADTDLLNRLRYRSGRAPRRVQQADYNLKRGRAPFAKPVWACQFTNGAYGARPHSLAGIGPCDVSLLRADVANVLRLRAWRRRRVLQKKRP